MMGKVVGNVSVGLLLALGVVSAVLGLTFVPGVLLYPATNNSNAPVVRENQLSPELSKALSESNALLAVSYTHLTLPTKA